MDPRRLQRILRQHVQTDALLGVDALPMGAVAEQAAAVTPAAMPPAPVSRRPPAAPPAADPGAPPGVPLFKPAPAGKPLDRATKLRVLQTMDQDEVKGCTKCGLHASRTNTVFGEGDPDASVMFIGEGPGQDEDEAGRPFVGRSGNLLEKMINAMGFQRDEVFIANVVKCRPPDNRTPAVLEADACWDYLRRQIETVRPKAIVTLGGPATKRVLDTNEGITRIRGQWREFTGVVPHIPVMPTFHPAYVLRNYTRENREKVWTDLQAVMERVR